MTDSARRPLIAGNWKLNKTITETEAYIAELSRLLPDRLSVDVTLAPPFVALQAAVRSAARTPVDIAAQNVFWETNGAYTGEISATMIADAGVRQVIIGHSERRQYFGETDQTVNKRIRAALSAGLTPILCIGETLEQRESGETEAVLQNQLDNGLVGCGKKEAAGIIVAYEPVWAIGSGKTATSELAQEVHRFIRAWFEKYFDKDLAKSLRILYGGSVKPDNVAALMAMPDIDGALVGGASLKAEVFSKIVLY